MQLKINTTGRHYFLPHQPWWTIVKSSWSKYRMPRPREKRNKRLRYWSSLASAELKYVFSKSNYLCFSSATVHSSRTLSISFSKLDFSFTKSFKHWSLSLFCACVTASRIFLFLFNCHRWCIHIHTLHNDRNWHYNMNLILAKIQ